MMSNGFLKFKKKIYLDACIKSLIGGLSVGFVTGAVLLTLSKQRLIPLGVSLCLLIGLAAALAAGALWFLILRPNAKRIAKLLDDEFSLDEKVQTMIALEGMSGGMIELQREDTAGRLNRIPTKSYKLKHVWQYAVLFVLALLLPITALVLPAKGDEPDEGPVDIPFEISSWQIAALQELIETVKASDMQAVPKATLVAELEGLLAALYDIETEGVMKTEVVAVITRTQTLLTEINTYIRISDHLQAAGFAPAAKLGYVVGRLNNDSFKQNMSEIRALFVDEALAADMNSFTAAINAALTNVGTEGEVLTVALKTFANRVDTIGDQMESYTVNWAQGKLEEAFTEAQDTLGDALAQQSTDKQIGEMVIARLMEIFGIETADLPVQEGQEPDDAPTGPDGDYKPEDDMEITDGGLGSGDVSYGSNDLFYDQQEGNGYVEYGEVFGQYFANLMEKKLDGTLPEALEKILDAYFELLSNDEK